MNKLNELRKLGYEPTLSASGALDIELPEGQELTQKLKARLQEIKPLLISDLRAEQVQRGSLYRFAGYMTRKDQRGKGRLIIELISNNSDEILKAYFNVNITYQRGRNKGDSFKTGTNGRFWVLPRSKFATFWVQTIGQPEKWSRVYRQMNYLRQFEFSGEEKISLTYKQLIDLKKVCKCF